MKKRATRIVAMLLLLLLLPTMLLAERRTYRSELPVGEMIDRLIDAMTEEKIRFTVKQIYNERRDGRSGFVVFLQPGQRMSEFTFHESEEGSLLQILTTSRSDSQLLHRLVTNEMKMVEVGITDIPDDLPSGWPSPSR